MEIGRRLLDEPSTGRQVLVAIESPQQAPDGTWECRFTVGNVGESPTTKTAFGVDGLQAMALALEGVRVTLGERARLLSWNGGEFGVTGFHRVIYAFGPELIEELEGHIDRRSEEYALECVAGQHRPAWRRS